MEVVAIRKHSKEAVVVIIHPKRHNPSNPSMGGMAQVVVMIAMPLEMVELMIKQASNKAGVIIQQALLTVAAMTTAVATMIATIAMALTLVI
jgi:hypothetical protein